MSCYVHHLTWRGNWTCGPIKPAQKHMAYRGATLFYHRGFFMKNRKRTKVFFSVFLDKTNVSTNRSVSLIKHCLTKQRQIANARDISDHDDPNAAITHLQCMLWQTCKSSIQLHRHHTLTGLTQRPFEPVLEKPKRRDHQSTYHTSLCSP